MIVPVQVHIGINDTTGSKVNFCPGTYKIVSYETKPDMTDLLQTRETLAPASIVQFLECRGAKV